jgi:putative sterol carrier protein
MPTEETTIMSDKTAAELIQKMPDAFRPERAGRANATIQFNISGQGGGDYYVVIKNKTCTVSEGTASKADATLKMSNEDFVALDSGTLNTMKAFASGRIKASGNIGLARKLERWFVRV